MVEVKGIETETVLDLGLSITAFDTSNLAGFELFHLFPL
jgi:hypothetical protein